LIKEKTKKKIYGKLNMIEPKTIKLSIDIIDNLVIEDIIYAVQYMEYLNVMRLTALF